MAKRKAAGKAKPRRITPPGARTRKPPENKRAAGPSAKKTVARTTSVRGKTMSETGKRLIPPKGGATVRMYRSGHGDCFLIAFAGEDEKDPAYVLIDCGYKPGSPGFIGDVKVKEITANIVEATGDGHLDVAIITHEHQDHVNGITESNFKNITIGQTWLAWTEKAGDPVADGLRRTFRDKLVGLVAARNRLAADGDAGQVKVIDDFLEFEWGGGEENKDGDQKFDVNAVTAQLKGAMLGAAGADAALSMNKRSMKVFKDRARDGVKYLMPHEEIRKVPGAKNARAFSLGPPRNEGQIRDLEPQGSEKFRHMALAAASPGNYFASAAAAPEEHGQSPFANRYCLDEKRALDDPNHGDFFTAHYGGPGVPEHCASPGHGGPKADEVPDNVEFRRIDNEWLYSAEQLALDMNDFTNNSSLVLAFELGRGGKVLLFAADAQRGNWVSWGKKTWKDGRKTVTARDLLGRTVLYKVGHHGSHNATLNGTAQDESPNLGWMATGRHAGEFTAMITAVRAWAETQKGWDHPLKAIKDALKVKASGRVFQTDTDLKKMKQPDGVSDADWKEFLGRCAGDRLYFDYSITP